MISYTAARMAGRASVRDDVDQALDSSPPTFAALPTTVQLCPTSQSPTNALGLAPGCTAPQQVALANRVGLRPAEPIPVSDAPNKPTPEPLGAGGPLPVRADRWARA